jgi:hypothetical protein
MPRLLGILVLFLLASTAFADDLTVGWISRSPDVDFVWNSAHPAVDGWPAAGAPIVWRGNVQNFGTTARSVAYRWTIDGRELATGRTTLAANTTSSIDLPSTWSFERHRIALAIDSGNEVTEESESNNRLEVFSDALAVGFWVERSLYDYFRAHQSELGTGATSWENWAQRQIDVYNDMAALAIYPETPHGVLDRWRIQKIVVVPDGALPLVPLDNYGAHDGEPNASTHPDKSDRSVDLMWGFRATTLGSFGNTHTATPANPFYLVPVLIHELGHARYLTDVYAWNVQSVSPHHTIDILDFAEPRMSGSYVHKTAERGLMTDEMTYIDRYSAIALNRIAGQRATRGNANDPENMGSFLNDLPAQNRLTIRDAAGQPIAGADVQIFRSEGESNAWYATHYDATPDLRLRTDANGQVLVGRNPFSSGAIVNYWRSSNVTAIVRVAKAGRVDWGYLESRLFNLAYWRGETQLADHDLIAGATCEGNEPPQIVAPAWDEKTNDKLSTVTWTWVPDAVGYDVWTAADGTPTIAATTTDTVAAIKATGRTWWWVEARFAHCPPLRSATARLVAPAAPVTAKRRAAGH